MSPSLPLPFEPKSPDRSAPAESKRVARQRISPRTAVGAPGFVSVRRAAELLDLRPRSVIYLLGTGLLKSQRLGRAHFLPVAEVERYRRVRRERAARARQRRAKSARIRLVK